MKRTFGFLLSAALLSAPALAQQTQWKTAQAAPRTLAQTQPAAPAPTPAPATPANAPLIRSGVQTTFSVDQLTGNYAARVSASTNYQITIVFPRKVQSIGVNAAKQQAVLTTIDQYDGRVVYVDVLRSGGTATLNIRMLTEADVYNEKTGQEVTADTADFGGSKVSPVRDPIILKMVVELTDKESGVLSYMVTPSIITATRPAPAPAPVAPVKVTPPAPVKVTPPKPSFFTGSNGNLTLTVTPASENAENQGYTYSVNVKDPPAGKSYFLDTSLTSLKVKNINVPAALTIPKAQTPVTAQAPATGNLTLTKKVVDQDLPRVLMFTVIERDNASGATKRRYVGVLLK